MLYILRSVYFAASVALPCLSFRAPTGPLKGQELGLNWDVSLCLAQNS